MSELVNKEAAAKYLAVSAGTLERLMRAGLPFVKIGAGRTGSVRFLTADLADFIAERRVHRVAATDSATGAR
jgi:phage terminase Nu1 subunit (DNA packaging protein)